MDLKYFVQDVYRHRFELYSVIVRQHGRECARFDWRAPRRENIQSASKAVTAVAVGMAVEEGILRLDERPAEIFADRLPENPSRNLLDMTVRDTLIMASGHDRYVLPGNSDDPTNPVRDEIEGDWVRYALSYDVPYKPGTHWEYGNFGPFLCSVIIRQRTGQTLRDYLMPRLFAPLGIKNPQWFTSPDGDSLGCAGLHLSPDELSRFGQLLADFGEWEGKRLVSESWIREASANLISNETPSSKRDKDRCAGYGYMFWRCARDDAYRAVGYGGQYAIVFPAENACVTITGWDFHEQKLLDCVWKNIVPQLKANG